ncbi:MlaA family lipoprotein [Gilvimarinus sp. F26214L]|uniref:MlaA family lipoprotein n=1 Tax=Gilvimarinus sp. DZF01 TaxID=3461371 RepID=UPI0040452D3A
MMGALALPAWGQEEEPVPDPWEGFNRKVFAFNETADRWVLKPVAQGYVKITPDPVEQGVSNFFGNLLEVRNVLNDILQWKWKQAGNDTGRFLINSTLGLAGIFDVARHMNLPKSEGEDFGQTLATWGVQSGPYVVLPFLGPSTIRDAGALPVDWVTNPIDEVDHTATRNSLWAMNFLDTRAGLLEAEALVSGDRYSFFREAFLQRRGYLINDGQVEDDFGDFDDFGDDYESDYEYDDDSDFDSDFE